MTYTSPTKYTWNSSMCSCRADSENGQHTYKACEEEHESWLLIVGSQELRRKELDIQKALRGELPDTFNATLRRFGKKGETFHRPPEVPADKDAPSAEVGFFLSESLGVYLTRCSDPERYADFLGNKAVRGLTEQMWRETWFTRFEPGGFCPVRPGELVSDGLITKSEAIALFDLDAVQQEDEFWDLKAA